MEEHTIYLIEQYIYKKLLEVEQALYGDGTRLTPDARRDLANKLNLINNEIRKNEVKHERT